MPGKARETVRTARTVEAVRDALEDNLYYARGANIYASSALDVHWAVACTVRDHLVDRYRRTVDACYAANPKIVYYLSAEYLLGRQLPQNLMSTGTTELVREALAHHDLDLDRLARLDPEPGLGNGGLGRLAACFLDSLATLGVPAIGYGIRYEFGIFEPADHATAGKSERGDAWLRLWQSLGDRPAGRVHRRRSASGATLEHHHGRRRARSWSTGSTRTGRCWA